MSAVLKDHESPAAKYFPSPAVEREQFLANRRRGIGGSDVAAILGMSPWKTALSVYLEKRGEAVDAEENEEMRWGTLLEPVIRQRYSDVTGRAVMMPDRIIIHQQNGFMVANLDGFTADNRVFEAKTARTANGWGEPGSSEVPDAYALQVQHYMAVTGFMVADIAVLIGGSDFRLYHVEADTSLQADIIAAEAEFWQRVQDGRPPEPVTFADAQQRYGRSASTGSVEADGDAFAAWQELTALRATIKAGSAREDELKAIVMRALGEHGDTLVSGGKTLATWKLAKATERFETTRFRASHPDLAAAFTVAGEPSRRFLMKE